MRPYTFLIFSLIVFLSSYSSLTAMEFSEDETLETPESIRMKVQNNNAPVRKKVKKIAAEILRSSPTSSNAEIKSEILKRFPKLTLEINGENPEKSLRNWIKPVKASIQRKKTKTDKIANGIHPTKEIIYNVIEEMLIQNSNIFPANSQICEALEDRIKIINIEKANEEDFTQIKCPNRTKICKRIGQISQSKRLKEFRENIKNNNCEPASYKTSKNEESIETQAKRSLDIFAAVINLQTEIHNLQAQLLNHHTELLPPWHNKLPLPPVQHGDWKGSLEEYVNSRQQGNRLSDDRPSLTDLSQNPEKLPNLPSIRKDNPNCIALKVDVLEDDQQKKKRKLNGYESIQNF